MAVQTDPLASGTSTSEGKLTIALCIVGVALEAFGGALQSALDSHPNTQWLAIASLVTGAAVQLFSLLGYSKNRTALKSNALVQAIAAGVPVVVAAVSQSVLNKLPPGTQAQVTNAALSVQPQAPKPTP